MKIKVGTDQLTIRTIADSCHGRWFGPDVTIPFVCTDSREADADTLFVALRGDRADGHTYIPDAIRSGCRMILCEKYPEALAEGISVVVVPDTEAALSMIARSYLAKHSPLRVAVTGSVGKTTTKEFLAAILGERFKTFKTEANYNSTIGMPMMALGVTPEHEAAVFEMGMSAKGEIEELSRLVCPEIAVITNIGTSHLEYLGSRENIAKAKLEIVEGLGEGGLLIVNGDEPLLDCPVRPDVRVKRVSLQGHGDYCAENIVLHPENGSTVFDLRTKDGVIHGLVAPALGEHIVYDAAFALAVGIEQGFSKTELCRGLLHYEKQKMHQELTETDGALVLGDCYNASPESMREALRVLVSYAKERRGRAIAVLGDMRELGSGSRRLHEEVGAFAVQLGIDYLLTLGNLGASIAEGAIGAGMTDDRIVMWRLLDDLDGAAKILEKEIRRGDVILVKASRAVSAERLIGTLVADRKGRSEVF